jgi:hypothetical protein
MSKREELIRRSVSELKAIQTYDELKASGTVVPDIMEAVILSGLEELKEFVEKMDSVPAEEIQAKITMFQDDNYMLPPEIGVEVNRLEDIPGGFDYLDAFGDDMDKKIEISMEEFGIYAQRLMDKAFGGMINTVEGTMQGMADAMGEMAKDMSEVVEEEKPVAAGYDSQNPEHTELLYNLYEAQSLEDLDKVALINYLEEELEYIYSELDLLTDDSFDGRTEDDMKRIAGMGQKVERLLPEMEKEFARLGTNSNSPEKADAILQELTLKFSSKISDIKKFLARVK